MSALSSFETYFDYNKDSEDEKQGDMKNPRSVHRICPDKHSSCWKYEPKVVNKTPLIEKLASALQRTSSADITIRIGNDEFSTSLMVLQCYSKYFQKVTRSKNPIELPASQISIEVFHKIGDWMIDNKKIVRRSDLMLMLRGAQFLEISYLENQILHIIQDAEKFKEDEALMLYLEANFLDCDQVKTLMMNRVQKFFLTFVSCEDFVLLDQDEIVKWLKLDSMGLNSEIEVFYAACRWILHDWNSRKHLLNKLISCVRFGLAEPWRIVELRMNKNQGRLKEILDDQNLQEILEKSLSYSTYRSCFPEDGSEKFYDFLHRFNLEELHPRTAMKDPNFERFKESRYTFADFEEYLKITRGDPCGNWKKNTIFNREPNSEFIIDIQNF